MGRALMYPAVALVAIAVIALVVYVLVRLSRKALRRRTEAADAELLESARWEAFQRPERGQWALGVECVAQLSSGPARRFPDEEVEHFPYSTDEFTLELRMNDKRDLAFRMNEAEKSSR